MASSKIIAVFFVLCVAQGLNARLYPRPSGLTLLGERFQQFTGNLQSRFQNCIQNALNALGQTQGVINQAAQQAVSQGASMEVAMKCVKAQQGSLEAFADSLAQRIEEVGQGLEGEIAEDLGPIAIEVREELDSMANTIRDAPKQVAQLIEEKKFLEAAKAFQAARDQVTVHIETIMGELEPAREAMPQIVERAEELSQQFLQDAFKGAETIKADVQQCIQNGGPIEA